MVWENAPDRSRGRRFALAGSREGNLAVIRDDVSIAATQALRRLAADEPPLCSPDAVPEQLPAYLSVLEAEGSAVEPLFGLLWILPGSIAYGHGVHLVWSRTAEGDALNDRFHEVMPASLVAAGFRSPTDLWQPWCVALENGQIAAIAQTVRRGPRGAEVGVKTAIGQRGRGLGAAVTAGWSSHPQLAHLHLFYSTARENTSSRRLTDRLGLWLVGSTFAIA
jgi:hypothetical protein